MGTTDDRVKPWTNETPKASELLNTLRGNLPTMERRKQGDKTSSVPGHLKSHLIDWIWYGLFVTLSAFCVTLCWKSIDAAQLLLPYLFRLVSRLQVPS
jgi:hypothetical protein